jgi:hypothetical protein
MSDLLFKVISAIGAVTGSWALTRSYWLTRSNLILSDESPEWLAYYEQGGIGPLEATLLVANYSSQANAIVRRDAWLKEVGGGFGAVETLQGQITDHKTGEVVGRFNVVPFNIQPHGVADCLVMLFSIRQSDFKQPFELKVRATDMYGKQFQHICDLPFPKVS